VHSVAVFSALWSLALVTAAAVAIPAIPGYLAAGVPPAVALNDRAPRRRLRALRCGVYRRRQCSVPRLAVCVGVQGALAFLPSPLLLLGAMAVDLATIPTFVRGSSVSSRRAMRPPRVLDGAANPPRIEVQRARKLVSAAEAVRKFPFAGLSSAGVNGHADVSREAFEEHLEGREACLLAAFEQALALAAARATAAFQAQEGWVDRVRAGLLALLEFFDEQPALARYCVVYSAKAGPAVLARRGEVLDHLARVLDDERAPARGYPPPLTAEAVVSGVLGVLHGRLCKPGSGALVALGNPLMSFIVLPFLGVGAARRELSRPLDATSAVKCSVALEVLQVPGGRLNHSAVSVLRVIGGEPGLNSSEVALRASLKKDPGQVSRLLSRLARLGLIESTRNPRSTTAAKAWRLTARGQEIEAAVRREAAAAASMAFDVPEQFGGRMDHLAVSVLRVIADQPWLYSREVALRAGVKDPAQISKLLTHLAGLGLLASARDAHRRGTPKVWQLTASGEKLDRAIGRESPPLPRSLALDLMWASGGRLSDDATSVLRVIAAEPGVSNNEIAARVRISDENSMSQLLARLARRGLIENTRTGGRYNVWQLTTSGIELESAIRQETPAPVARSIALDLLKDRGGRLNHRAVSVLRLIAAEPGHSNQEIALRVGIEQESHISELLARLARFGLIENTRTRGRENVWQLTASGKELERTIRHENPDAGR
jgi:DNA-binding MarR family transcriptional regulator/AcrR family transcriptional regulator